MKIKFIILTLIVILIIIYISNNSSFSNLENNNKKKEQSKIINLKVYKTASALGHKYINGINKVNKTNKSAVMFDIDDTLLYVKNDSLIPIKPMIDLLNYCIKKNLLIIIITARDQKYKKYTIDDLNNNGINYSFLYLRKSPEDDNENFKSKIKEQLYSDYGIKILMSIGDQYIDIIGPKSGYGLKLPSKTDKKLYETSPDGSKLIEVKLN